MNYFENNLVINQSIRVIEDASKEAIEVVFNCHDKSIFCLRQRFKTKYWCKKFAQDYWISINQDIKRKCISCPKRKKCE